MGEDLNDLNWDNMCRLQEKIVDSLAIIRHRKVPPCTLHFLIYTRLNIFFFLPSQFRSNNMVDVVN